MSEELLKLDYVSVESLLKQRFAGEKITTLKDLPPPQSLCNLVEIAQCIKVAMQEKKRIVIVGDYDVDGVVSCAILHEFFDKIGYAVTIEIPNRFSDGYGLSLSVIERLECDVIITVDNGINAVEAAQMCKDRGIMLLITDHHTPKEVLPDALICNPKLSNNFPEPEICGACVAWYLCAALKAQIGLEVAMVEFLDLLALAIVSDVMPLRGMNRVLLKKGLEVFKKSKRLALVHLKEQFFKQEINEQCIGYYIAPLLNCAGRMDSAMLAYAFLVEKDKEHSKVLLEKLLAMNGERKALQNAMYAEAKVNAQKDKDKPFIVAFNPSWHEGIVGIIAARLSEEFIKPSIALTQKDGILKGSMRSNCVDCMQVLESVREHLNAFGGHFGAAGLSLKQEALEGFKNALESFEYTAVNKASKWSGVLGYLPLSAINARFFKMVQEFAPFGNANAIPKFYVRGRIANVRYFGVGHSQIYLKEFKATCSALAFNQDLREYKHQEIECLCTLQWDHYMQNVVLCVEHYVLVES